MDIFAYSEKLNNLAFLGTFAEFTQNAVSAGVIGDAPDFDGGAICLGDFDGVHLGHQCLFEFAKKEGRWGVLLFDRDIKENGVLTTLSERLEIINGLGADYAVIAQFDEEFKTKTPEAFVGFLKNKLKVKTAIAGYDYRFGYKASGDTEDLKQLCNAFDIQVKIADAVKIAGTPVKSTKIRDAVKSGDLAFATKLLGRHYTISGDVVKGLENGRKMGFPTANIEVLENKILPPDGVYFGKVCKREAVINIGKNLTFDAKKRTIEAHIPGFSGNLYGARVNAEIIERIRSVIKFESQDALTEQIKRDVEWIKDKRDN